MGQAGNNNNVNSQKPRKLTLKGLIILLFFTFAVGAILFCYFIFKKDKKPTVNVVESTSSEAEEKKDAES